ncbi:hypothetical protein [Leptospira santarosai]|uniref:hypothetical protein n=1 Tax=Leptospira santarosai TaxID=28183 RepID=UPI000519BB8E|nr:hypothetical protein [Leptospira santarosai]AVV78345.1 Uncharacterized protein XB15_00548 [Leptospira santarosai]MDI7167030.1 hypothetical protein [Leptospira santarosai]MDI7219425.1 hypothetical protein [Leptospira santarosai]ONF87005.1 hypothetical protein BWD13_07335 [Leptospira santarosai serovar Grippotyphosa]
MKRIIFLLMLVVACSKFASDKQQYLSNVKLPLYKETASGSEVVYFLVKGNEFEIKEKRIIKITDFLGAEEKEFEWSLVKVNNTQGWTLSSSVNSLQKDSAEDMNKFELSGAWSELPLSYFPQDFSQFIFLEIRNNKVLLNPYGDFGRFEFGNISYIKNGNLVKVISNNKEILIVKVLSKNTIEIINSEKYREGGLPEDAKDLIPALNKGNILIRM